MMAACANRGEVLSAGHAALYHHGGLGFVSMRCSVTPSISSIVVMMFSLSEKKLFFRRQSAASIALIALHNAGAGVDKLETLR
jgi:hypothetical protein